MACVEFRGYYERICRVDIHKRSKNLADGLKLLSGVAPQIIKSLLKLRVDLCPSALILRLNFGKGEFGPGQTERSLVKILHSLNNLAPDLFKLSPCSFWIDWEESFCQV